MHGQKTLLNGMIPMGMAEVTIHQERLPTFVLPIQELRLDRVRVVTAGAVQIPMVMAGQI